MVKEIEYFLNHSWHHTVRSAPYNVFFGRLELKNIGKLPAQPEFMEEDFLFSSDMDVNSTASKGAISIPIYNVHNSDILSQLAHKQTLQEKQKRDVFEATEATISRNKRSQLKKIRSRSFSVGDTVLFKNPRRSTIATTLNIEGVIEEKVGRDLYRVANSDGHMILFSAQMVPNVATIRTKNTADGLEA